MRSTPHGRLIIPRCWHGLPGQQGVDVSKAQVAAAIAAPFCRFLALDDGEGRIDVTDIVTALRCVGGVEQPVDDEIERIGLGAKVEAAVFVPDEGRQHLADRIDMAQVAREGCGRARCS